MIALPLPPPPLPLACGAFALACIYTMGVHHFFTTGAFLTLYVVETILYCSNKVSFLMVFKDPKVQKINRWRAPREPKGSKREQTLSQNGDQKGPRVEKSILQKPLFYLSKTIILESQGGQKALKSR